MGAKLKCVDDRLDQLTKQNEEFSTIIERLLTTIQTGKGLYENRFTEMQKRQENELRSVMSRWLSDKFEAQIHELEEKGNKWASEDQNSRKLIKRLETRIQKMSTELEVGGCSYMFLKRRHKSLF